MDGVRRWYSKRFQTWVYLTKHVYTRMLERELTLDIMLELIETGQLHVKNEAQFWIYKEFSIRNDNLICAAVSRADTLIIKTVMHRWELRNSYA